MQVALQTYDRGDERRRYAQRLRAMENEFESSIPVIVKQVEQVKALTAVPVLLVKFGCVECVGVAISFRAFVRFG